MLLTVTTTHEPATDLGYRWPTDGATAVRLAPFQVLASDGAAHHGRPHPSHPDLLDRVAAGESLWRVHECVFAVLALESEPVDPRL